MKTSGVPLLHQEVESPSECLEEAPRGDHAGESPETLVNKQEEWGVITMTKKWGDNSGIIHMFQKRGNDPRKIMDAYR